MIDLVNKLWQAFLPLGGVFIALGIQIYVDLGSLYGAVACWIIAFVWFVVRIGGLIWAFKVVRKKELEDKVLQALSNLFHNSTLNH